MRLLADCALRVCDILNVNASAEIARTKRQGQFRTFDIFDTNIIFGPRQRHILFFRAIFVLHLHLDSQTKLTKPS